MRSVRSSFTSLATLGCLASAVVALGFAAKDTAGPAATPAELVTTYESLADSILAVKKTEANLVSSILATTLAHAAKQAEAAKTAAKAGDAKAVGAAVQDLAALVGQLGTEGDNSVARVRKRLVEGGHHHNAAGEAQGVYDEGYVIVTKAAKKRFLDTSKAIAGLGGAATSEAIDREWKNVHAAWDELMKSRSK